MGRISRRQKRKKGVLGVVVLIVFLLLIAGAVSALLYDARHAELELSGQSGIVLEYGEKYADAGAKAFSRGRLFGELDTPIDVYAYIPRDIDELGEHEVKYCCSYLGKTYEAVRSVTVTEETPLKTPSGSEERGASVTRRQPSPFSLPGVRSAK